MSAPLIIVTPKGDRSGRLMARTEGIPDMQVGQVCRIDPDGAPKPEWKAWLWPSGGQYPPLTRSVEALTRASTDELIALLNRRVEHEGAWWR